MINDVQLMYFMGSDLATAGTSNVVDMRGYPRNAANPLRLVFALNDVPVGGTSVQFKIETSPTIDFTTPTTAYTSQAFSTTGIKEPTILLQIHPIPSLQRYSRIVLTKGGTFTSGRVSAFITWGEDFPQMALETEQGVR